MTKSLSFPFDTPAVVATVHDDATLKAALTLRSKEIDALEIRVDGFPGREDWLRTQAARLRYPLIVTVRHPREGGIHALKVEARKKLYQNFFEIAAAIDIELSSVDELRDVIQLARDSGVLLVLSHHDFKSTPEYSTMRRLVQRAKNASADVFKIATTLRTPDHLAALHKLILKTAFPVSAMGMGSMGKISRLLLARAGSVLNYGYLCRPQVTGQWPAGLLRKRIEELDA